MSFRGLRAMSLVTMLALSGCSLPGEAPEPAPSGSPTATGPIGQVANPNIGALLAAVIEEDSTLAALGTAHPRLARRTTALRGVLRAHIAFLAGLEPAPQSTAPQSTGTATPTPAGIADARDQVSSRVTALVASYADAAASEPNPALARAFASLAAGATQGLVAGRWQSPLPPAALGTSLDPATTALTPSAVDALQRVLAMEHAALWSYGVLGASTSAADAPELFAAMTTGYEAHRTARDEVYALLRNLGHEPVASEVAYVFDEPLRTPTHVAAAARALESDTAATYAWLVAQVDADPDSGGGLRRWALTALGNAAIRELVAQGTPENFPGADELADR